jgi:autotransporter-associated beta strand protein
MRWIVTLLGVIALMNTQAWGQTSWTWNQTTSGNWNTSTNWAEGTVPASAATTQLTFNASGTTSYTATNNIGAATFTLNRLTVNNTGTGTVTITGAAAANTLTFAGTDPTLDITGTSLFLGLMAGSATVTKVGSGTFIHDSNNSGFTGTLIVNAGTFVNRATNVATTNFNPVSIVVNNGGTYQFGAATVGDPNLPNSTYITVNTGGIVEWQEGETYGGILMQGGLVNLSQGGMTMSGTIAQTWQSGTIQGGAFTIGGANAINKTTSGTVTIQGSASITTTTGGLNIQEGTIAMVNAANLGTANITLGTATTAGTFEYQGVTATRAGTFTMAGDGAIAVTNANTILTLSGNFSGSGILSKTGSGTLHLTGTLDQTGTTSVAAGTLRVNPVTATGNFTVTDGAVLAVNNGAGTASFTAPNLGLGTIASTVRFELNSTSLPTVPLAVVSTSNGLTGVATLAMTNAQPFAIGTYTLIDYSGTEITSGFGLSLPGRTAGSLVYNAANTSIDANITSLGDTVKWGGQVNGTWDIGTAANVGGTNNWRLLSNNNDTNYINGDTVSFDDTASGNFNVTIPATVSPASITVNNSANNYTFQGAGGIGGGTTLTKTGTGTLTVSTTNSFSGLTTVNNGTLTFTTGGSIGGSLTVNAGAVNAVTNAIPGNVTLNGGTLSISSQDNLSSASGVTFNGGTLRVTGTYATGANTQVFTMTGPGTINVDFFDPAGLEPGAFGVGKNGDSITGPGNLTKTGPGWINFGSAGGTGFTGAIAINDGVFSYTSNRLTNSGDITVASGGTLALVDTTTFTLTSPFLTNVGSRIILNGNGYANGGAFRHQLDEAGSSNAGVSWAITLNTTSRFVMTNGTRGTRTANDTLSTTFTGIISGAGGIVKAGAQTMILAAANTYAGPTNVEAGRLLVNGQTGSDSGTGTGAVSVQSGGTLGGNGRIGGAVTINAGGILAPGTTTATPTLTVGSTVAVNGIYAVNFFGTAAADFGALAGQGAVTYGGAGSSVALNLGTVTVADLRNAVGIGNTRNYTIVQSTGTISGAFGNAATSGPIDFTSFGFDTSEWTITYGSNQTVLSFTPVPEPMTMLAIGLAGTGLIAIRRRRSRNG